MFADQGDKVAAAGQVLGDIHPVDIDQRLQNTSAALSRAQNAVMVSEAQVRDALSRNALAQTNAKRYDELFDSQAISRELADTKQNEADSGQASLDTQAHWLRQRKTFQDRFSTATPS